MKRLLSKRVLGAICLLLFLLFLLRPGAEWMKVRVSNSIAQSVGRRVQIGSVRLQFLPRPGFEIDDLLVRDDPAFGAEPIVRAQGVTAAVSLGALARGKIQIARLSLSEPSLNLTRNPDGRWNLEDLIARTSHSIAPAESSGGSSGPGFPYIEATGARVNLKLGTEKTHFALTNAEFALWQESSDTWGARLQARPIRTDANLTDTGVINVSGLWRRSVEGQQTPIQVSFQWKQAQIGQVSKLFYGTDKDWRGAALISGNVFGTATRLKVSADATVNDFRRQDIMGGDNLRLAAHCTGEFIPPSRELANLDCSGPIGGGYVQLKGDASGILLNGEPFAKSDLWIVANHAPAQSLVNLLKHSRPEFTSDLQVAGDLTSSINVYREELGRAVAIHGSGSIDSLRISRGEMDPVNLDSVPFTVSNASTSPEDNSKHHAQKLSTSPPVQELHADLGPINLATGKFGPLLARATISRNSFTGSVHGDTNASRLLQTAKALNLPAPMFNGDGAINVNLRFSGNWFSDERPLVTGVAHLRAIHAQVRGMNAPIVVQNADITVGPDSVTVQNLAASALEASWRGSLIIPRPCAKPADCKLQFKLHADRLTATALNEALNPAQRTKAWYKFLSLGRDLPSYLLQLRAAGTIVLDRLSLGRASCSHFSSDLQLDSAILALSAFKADCLDGTAVGNWRGDFSVSPPAFSGNGTFDHVSLTTIAELMHDGWVEGTGGAEYQFKASGSSIQDLLNSADLQAQFKLSSSRFPHVVFTSESGPLNATDFSGMLRLANRGFSFEDAKLTSGSEVYTVSGTASLGGALNLKVTTDNAAGYAIGGTLVKTRVSVIPNAEASLK